MDNRKIYGYFVDFNITKTNHTSIVHNIAIQNIYSDDLANALFTHIRFFKNLANAKVYARRAIKDAINQLKDCERTISDLEK